MPEPMVLVLEDGFTVFGERGGQATGALFTQPPPDQRILMINGASADGRKFAARLRPQR